ncbi:MAG TPA: NADPH:quinone oxidoreductase family protein [Jatrophihabitantaceae bacterium]|jgi:NADPH2:quinone reductase
MTMLAAQISRYGGVESVGVDDVADPVRENGTVLVEVLAAGLNAYDLLMLANRYQVSMPLPYIPGTEFVGTVREAPAGCGLAIEDRVVGKVQSGALAERVVCPPHALRPAGDWMTIDQAASYRVTYETAMHALHTASVVRPGDWVLVGGASGGVGHALLDTARALGVQTIAACRPKHFDACGQAGALACVDISSDDVGAQVRSLSGGGGVAAAYDTVGGDFSLQAVRAVRPGGTVVVLGFASGEISSVPLNRILLKGITLTGFQNRTVTETHPERAQTSLDVLNRLVEQHQISPVVGARFALGDVRAALAALTSRNQVGKVVVRMPVANGAGDAG